jgi:hypothetical protein
MPSDKRNEQMAVPDMPALAAGVERRDCGSYGVIAPPGAGSMLHLEPDELAVLDLIDGTRTQARIEVAFGAPVTELLGDLWDEGYLVGALEPQDQRVTVTLHGVEFRGFDRFVQVINRCWGDAVFSFPAGLLFLLVAISGLALFMDQVATGHRLTVSAASPILAVVALRVLGLAAVGPHETGHALVIARNHRRVGRMGIGFYWGALTFYVDASQALFLPRRARMLQSSAGVLTDLVVCGTASIVAMTGGDATWAVVLREFAVLGYLNIIINAVPLLELDGYWFLADALDRPTLQRDARRALANVLRGQRASLRLAAYAAASLVFGIALILLGFVAWWGLFGGLVRTLWQGGPGYKILAAYLLLPFVPIIIHLFAQPVRYLRNRATLIEPAVGS